MGCTGRSPATLPLRVPHGQMGTSPSPSAQGYCEDLVRRRSDQTGPVTSPRPQSHCIHGHETRNRMDFVYPSWRWFTFNAHCVPLTVPNTAGLVSGWTPSPPSTCSSKLGLLLPPWAPGPAQLCFEHPSPRTFPTSLLWDDPQASRPGPRLSWRQLPGLEGPPPASLPQGLCAGSCAPPPSTSPGVTDRPASSPSALHSSGCLTPMVFNLCSSSEEVSCRTKYKATE